MRSLDTAFPVILKSFFRNSHFLLAPSWKVAIFALPAKDPFV